MSVARLTLTLAFALLAFPCLAAPSPEEIIDALSPPEAPVYALTIDNGHEAIDWYAYFTSEGGALKLRAVRSLSAAADSYDAMVLTQKTARSDQEEWDYQSLRIAFMPDLERLAHFRKQLGALDGLRTAIDARDSQAIRSRMRALHFKDWERVARGRLELRLGGPFKGVVGVLYIPPGEKLPPINETGHLYIERIDGPWYVYKTT